MTKRATFRPVSTETAWQKQLRDRYLSDRVPPVPTLNVKSARVRPVSRHLATQIILKYEWLGTMATTSEHYGIFFGCYCAGVACIGFYAGANVYAGQELGVRQPELAYLARGACVHWAPPGTNSRLVSWAARLLPKTTPAKLLIAYADPDAGEIGTIYQACNWAYIGQTHGPLEWVAPNGRVLNDCYPNDYAKRYGGTGKHWRQRLRQAGWTQQSPSLKYRYVCLLDTTDRVLEARIDSLRQPYPKRATSIVADASPDQGEEGGATPTVALPGPM
jgi:hypothetical protein